MPTLFNIYTLLSFAQLSTPSQALGLEALTPCVLTASDGVVVQAYCEESITPCVLTGSNGAIVSAYCEPTLVSQPFASITGISALRNTTETASTFQILGTDKNTVSKAIPCRNRVHRSKKLADIFQRQDTFGQFPLTYHCKQSGTVWKGVHCSKKLADIFGRQVNFGHFLLTHECENRNIAECKLIHLFQHTCLVSEYIFTKPKPFRYS